MGEKKEEKDEKQHINTKMMQKRKAILVGRNE